MSTFWDERFAGEGYVYGVRPNDWLREAYAYLPQGAVLSLGEGEGRNAVFLAEQGLAVTAVDSSRVGLAKAQRLARQRGVRINTVACDLAEYHVPEQSWDGIISIFCHLPPELRRTLHQRVVAALRPGGVLLLEAYTPAQLHYASGGPRSQELLVTLEALWQELAGLELRVAHELERTLTEGEGHCGLSAVVRIAGFK